MGTDDPPSIPVNVHRDVSNGVRDYHLNDGPRVLSGLGFMGECRGMGVLGCRFRDLSSMRSELAILVVRRLPLGLVPS